MENKNSSYPAWKRLFSIILVAVFFLSFLGTTAISCVSNTLWDRDFFVKSMTSRKYIEAVKEELVYQITSVCNKSGISADIVCKGITDNDVYSVCYQYYTSLFNVMNGTETEMITITYPRNNISEAVKNACNNQENSHYIDNDTQEKIISNLTNKITNSLNIVTSQRIVSYAQKAYQKVLTLQKFEKLKYIFAILSVISVAMVLLWTKRTTAGALYALSATGLMSAGTLLMPLLMLKFFDLGSKIALNTSTLKISIKYIIDSVIQGCISTCLISFVLFAILLVGASVLYSANNNRKN